jgi:hypothetical protein
MPLMGIGEMMGYLNGYRVLHLDGRMGSGKTALAFRLAYEFVMKYGYRYILSNVKSVWTDDPADVSLREGRYVDAVIILDEGGLFIENTRDAKEFVAYLRKLNIIIIVPSVEVPAERLRKLTCERTLNIEKMSGLPIWWYELRLRRTGKQDITGSFWWWKPSEIYGIYDTLAYPGEGEDIRDFLKIWITAAKSDAGYTPTKNGGQSAYEALQTRANISPELLEAAEIAAADEGAGSQPGTTSSGDGAILGELRRVASSLEDASRSIERSSSISEGKNRKKRRR